VGEGHGDVQRIIWIAPIVVEQQPHVRSRIPGHQHDAEIEDVPGHALGWGYRSLDEEVIIAAELDDLVPLHALVQRRPQREPDDQEQHQTEEGELLAVLQAEIGREIIGEQGHQDGQETDDLGQPKLDSKGKEDGDQDGQPHPYPDGHLGLADPLQHLIDIVDERHRPAIIIVSLNPFV